MKDTVKKTKGTLHRVDTGPKHIYLIKDPSRKECKEHWTLRKKKNGKKEATQLDQYLVYIKNIQKSDPQNKMMNQKWETEMNSEKKYKGP